MTTAQHAVRGYEEPEIALEAGSGEMPSAVLADNGAGPGLLMVYGAVQNRRGLIDRLSEPERGARVSTCLPRYSAEAVVNRQLRFPENSTSEIDLVLMDGVIPNRGRDCSQRC